MSAISKSRVDGKICIKAILISIYWVNLLISSSSSNFIANRIQAMQDRINE